MKVSREDVIGLIGKANVVADATVLRDDVRLADQGIDSLGIFNILLVISEKYGFEIPDEDVDKLRTVGDLVDYLNSRM